MSLTILREELRGVEKDLQNAFGEITEQQDRIAAEGDERGGRANKIGELNRRVEKLEDRKREITETIEELEQREARLQRAARETRGHEAGDHYHTNPAPRARAAEPSTPAALRSQALAANERAELLPEKSREHMERMLRADDDPDARLARFTVEFSTPEYREGFLEWMADPVSGGHSWRPEVREAVRRATLLARSLNLTGAQGGFLVPYELDPNIVIASTGYEDPMRAVSRVETTAFNEKRFVTSTGVRRPGTPRRRKSPTTRLRYSSRRSPAVRRWRLPR